MSCSFLNTWDLKITRCIFLYWYVTFKFIHLNEFSLFSSVDIMVAESSWDYKLTVQKLGSYFSAVDKQWQ